MKNRFLILILLFTLTGNGQAENLKIEAKNITLDKKKFITIFENEVVVKTEDKGTIKSDYVEYNKNTGLLKLKIISLPLILKII